MTLSKAFKEGMKYPERRVRPNGAYIKVSKQESIVKAWANTGEYLRKAMKQYDGSKR